ncbi:MAG: hypothetical protein LBI15_11845 [Dysgonamonadaceae bacterium]|nr:hypothetical protein [Dysgonamonadaceae bacterium]
MATAVKMSKKITPTIYPMQQTASDNRSSAYYSASEFRKLAQEDLQLLLKKNGRI